METYELATPIRQESTQSSSWEELTKRGGDNSDKGNNVVLIEIEN